LSYDIKCIQTDLRIAGDTEARDTITRVNVRQGKKDNDVQTIATEQTITIAERQTYATDKD